MSAHCDKCGSDMVYGTGEDWQLMECPVCALRAALDAERALRQQTECDLGDALDYGKFQDGRVSRLEQALTEIASLSGNAQHLSDIRGPVRIARVALGVAETKQEPPR